MTALDARYHKQCLTAMANTNTNPKSEFNIEQAIGGIMMGELIIYIIWERDQTDADVNSTRIKERLIIMCQTEQLTKGPTTRCFVYLQKILGGCLLINQNTPRQCCSHTSWGYSNCKQMMSNSTESNGSFDKECPTGSSNESFSLHQHDAQDNNSWSKWPWLPLCIVVQFNGPKTLITL